MNTGCRLESLDSIFAYSQAVILQDKTPYRPAHQRVFHQQDQWLCNIAGVGYESRISLGEGNDLLLRKGF
jgi:hypothetical protein